MNGHTGNTQPSIDQEEHRSVNGINAKAVVPYGFDGASLSPLSAPMALKSTLVGSVTYYGQAPAGSAQSSAVWRCFKVDSTPGSPNITWAGGTTAYVNVATDLTALTYS